MRQDIAENGELNDFRARKRQLQADIDYKVLGRHMQAVRQQRGLTQAVVAEQMKVGTKYYSAFEGGKAKISLYRLIQFICLMGTSADCLLVGCHRDYPSHHIRPEDDSEDRKLLLSVLDQCSDDTIRIMRIVAEALLESEK